MIIGPAGVPISDTLRDEEGIIYADIDIEQTIIPKQFHDVVGYYNRFDIFDLHVDNSRREPVMFASEFEDPHPTANPRAEDPSSSMRQSCGLTST